MIAQRAQLILNNTALSQKMNRPKGFLVVMECSLESRLRLMLMANMAHNQNRSLLLTLMDLVKTLTCVIDRGYGLNRSKQSCTYVDSSKLPFSFASLPELLALSCHMVCLFSFCSLSLLIISVQPYSIQIWAYLFDHIRQVVNSPSSDPQAFLIDGS